MDDLAHLNSTEVSSDPTASRAKFASGCFANAIYLSLRYYVHTK